MIAQPVFYFTSYLTNTRICLYRDLQLVHVPFHRHIEPISLTIQLHRPLEPEIPDETISLRFMPLLELN